MRPEDFSREAPGALVRSAGPSGEYWTYVPNPLPPPLRFDADLVRCLSEADQAIGELKGAGRMLPNPHLLIGPFLRREAVASSRIEGTITDLRQLVLFEADPLAEGHREDLWADHQEVLNYVTALEYGLKRLVSLPVSSRLMREIHERLMAGVRGQDKTPGEFRDRQNAIGRPGQPPSEARFVPPPVPQMRQALGDLERFLSEPSGLPVLVDLALIHYQFETIHPFLDGNGRLGRLLISMLLCERQCLTQPLLYLSAYFETHRDAYADGLLRVSQAGAWGAWVRFFLEGVTTQSREAIARCRSLLDLWNTYRSELQDAGQSANLLRLVDVLFEKPAITASMAGDKLGLTFRAAQNNIERLLAKGILTEVTGKPRNRVYFAPRILAIIAGDEDSGIPPR